MDEWITMCRESYRRDLVKDSSLGVTTAAWPWFANGRNQPALRPERWAGPASTNLQSVGCRNLPTSIYFFPCQFVYTETALSTYEARQSSRKLCLHGDVEDVAAFPSSHEAQVSLCWGVNPVRRRVSQLVPASIDFIWLLELEAEHDQSHTMKFVV